MIKIKSLSVLFSFLFLIVLLSGCVIEGNKPNIDVKITDVFYEQAISGESKTVFLNITFTNKGDEEIDNTFEHINPLLIVTNTGRERLISSDYIGFEKIPAYESVNITAYTYESNSLKLDETPVTFVYTYGSGEVLPPTPVEVEIPRYLIEYND